MLAFARFVSDQAALPDDSAAVAALPDDVREEIAARGVAASVVLRLLPQIVGVVRIWTGEGTTQEKIVATLEVLLALIPQS